MQHQRGLGRGQRLAGIHAFARQAARKTIGVVEQIQHRRNHQRAHHAADDEHHLLTPGRSTHQVAGLQVLQVVVGDGCHGQHHRDHEEHQRHAHLPRN